LLTLLQKILRWIVRHFILFVVIVAIFLTVKIVLEELREFGLVTETHSTLSGHNVLRQRAAAFRRRPYRVFKGSHSRRSSVVGVLDFKWHSQSQIHPPNSPGGAASLPGHLSCSPRWQCGINDKRTMLDSTTSTDSDGALYSNECVKKWEHTPYESIRFGAASKLGERAANSQRRIRSRPN
jgi:hypothetical protein